MVSPSLAPTKKDEKTLIMFFLTLDASKHLKHASVSIGKRSGVG